MHKICTFIMGLPPWLSSKESACNGGAPEDKGWEDPLKERMATNSSFLAKKIS